MKSGHAFERQSSIGMLPFFFFQEIENGFFWCGKREDLFLTR